MDVRNVHERGLAAPASRVGPLLDSLASANDALWPGDRWPAMKFDRPLAVGAVGGHGPIGYTVEEYVPGRRVWFRFTAPRGFNGSHGFDLVPLDEGRTLLRHVLEMRTGGAASLTWPLVFRPLHDALLEDALDRAERSLGLLPRARSWSLWVRLLRRLLSGGRAGARPQA